MDCDYQKVQDKWAFFCTLFMAMVSIRDIDIKAEYIYGKWPVLHQLPVSSIFANTWKCQSSCFTILTSTWKYLVVLWLVISWQTFPLFNAQGSQLQRGKIYRGWHFRRLQLAISWPSCVVLWWKSTSGHEGLWTQTVLGNKTGKKRELRSKDLYSSWGVESWPRWPEELTLAFIFSSLTDSHAGTTPLA